MRKKENTTHQVTAAFGLTLAILVTFQIYIWREPTRIASDESQDQLMAVTAGRSIFEKNCTMCHGEEGEGVDGPPLNDKTFLATTSDETIFSLVSSGVPGSEMPAWNQANGGPFTDQQIRQVVTFVRNWELEAPDRQALAMQGNPVNGLVIFDSTCVVCHGEGGIGSERAPALNDPVKLAHFDDRWYESTIASGRPAQGMPTWGTVLSPEQIRDLVALLRAWGRGESIQLPGPDTYLHEAAHALGHGELEEVEHQLVQAAKVATGDQLQAINDAIQALSAGDTAAVQKALDEAEAHDGRGDMMPGMDMGNPANQPGEIETRAALEDLETGAVESAQAKLKVAQVLAQGDLKEAIEHALGDITAGKIDEAVAVLKNVLGDNP